MIIGILSNMSKKISHRGPNKEGFFIEEAICLAQRNLSDSLLPMTLLFEGNSYTIIYDGEIYNSKEIKQDLIDSGFTFSTNSEAEILLKAFIHYGYSFVKHLNGGFAIAIWDNKKEELFLARDHFGIKPIYYTEKNGEIIFSSEIKGIFQYPEFNPTINSTGICELFGIGPAHTPGLCPFKDIYEIKPANYIIFRKESTYFEEYWKLESKPHHDNFDKTCDNIKNLLEDSIEKQMVSEKKVCTFLSGGLDSSIITFYASNYHENNHLGKLQTYSVDYLDNDKNFVKTDFQPNSDKEYIALMQKKLNTKHKQITLDTPELIETLKDAMIARDFPGMADVDSSLLLFCKKVKEEKNIALTGECADEIFAGYPWFFREDALESNTFPWSLAYRERQNLLNPNISSKLNLKEYIDYRFLESFKKVEILDTDSKETSQKRKISYLTLNWFMQTLLDRSDRMAMYSGLNLRVPFCDYRIVQYLWNIPWDIKALNGREKGLLRYIVKKELPSEIVDRKKSPYPKTWNPTYTNAVKEMLSNILKNSNAPIYELLNKTYINEILQTEGKSFSRPWFGQLMTGPQLMAYLIQVNQWLEKYNPKIEI